MLVGQLVSLFVNIQPLVCRQTVVYGRPRPSPCEYTQHNMAWWSLQN